MDAYKINNLVKLLNPQRPRHLASRETVVILSAAAYLGPNSTALITCEGATVYPISFLSWASGLLRIFLSSDYRCIFFSSFFFLPSI